MKNTPSAILKGYLAFIGLFHTVVGIGLNCSDRFPQIMADLYGAKVIWTPQFLYILKPLGAFMFVLGVLAFAAMQNPLQNRGIIHAFVLLFTIRALQRLIFQNEVTTSFTIDAGRNMTNIVFFLLMAAGLFVLTQMASKNSVS